jgi:tetratricopeptide (TPR) repeat protein
MNNLSVALARALAAAQTGDIQRALQVYTRIAEQFPEMALPLQGVFTRLNFLSRCSAPELYFLASFSLAAGQYDSALVEAACALRLAPNHERVRALHNTARQGVSAQRSSPTRSRRATQEYLEQMQLGHRALASGSYDLATRHFRSALVELPEDEDALRCTALSRMLRGGKLPRLLLLGRYALSVGKDWLTATLCYMRVIALKPHCLEAIDGLKSAAVLREAEEVRRKGESKVKE